MKPKTKLQLQVASICKKLIKITREHKAWVSDTLLKHYVYRTKHKHFCLKCGKSWAVSKEPALAYLLDDLCPHCGAALKSLPGKKRTLKDREYFQIATTVENMQVLRCFAVERKCKVGQKMEYFIEEVIQHWINSKGRYVIRSTKYNPLGYYNDRMWIFGSPLEIRGAKDGYYFQAKMYPRPRYMKEIRRNGFKGGFHDIHPAWLFQIILRNPMAETLLKAGQYSLLRKFSSIAELLYGIWPSIRICLRNNYIVKDAETWIDHLRMLTDMGMDVLNAAYVCPENLKAEHQRLINRHNRWEKKKEVEQRKRDIKKYNEIFRKKKARYFGLNFTNGKISVAVIEDVEDYYEEGNQLKHCVFANKYFEKPDTICLSARKLIEVLATIELSLKNWKVLQCRGKNNATPSNHEDIIALVENNIDSFKKRVRLHKEKKELIPTEL